jgi:hypothetical protein
MKKSYYFVIAFDNEILGVVKETVDLNELKKLKRNEDYVNETKDFKTEIVLNTSKEKDSNIFMYSEPYYKTRNIRL